MGKLTVYRYDSADYADGAPLTKIRDHFPILTDGQKKVETAIRDKMNDGHVIRSTSVYSWKHKQFAERVWKHRKEAHLYELEIDDEDVCHTGDLDFFSAAEADIENGRSAEKNVQDYIDGKITGERVEILVTKAKVIRRLKHSSEH